jgi:hypothetical protein
MMIKRPEWLDGIKADGQSNLTAHTINSSTSCACAGVIDGEPMGKLTAVSMNGRTVFVRINPTTEGKYRVSYEAIYKMFTHVKPGYCLVPR